MVKLEQIFDLMRGGFLLSIRFIHTADLHLDSPFKGMTGLSTKQLQKLRDSTFTAFSTLIHHAVESKPDFVLIVGDIYDGENRSLRAQMKFQEGMEQLNEAAIPVYLSYGNHDHLSGRWTRFKLPSNVHVFNGEVETAELKVNGKDVSISGFSYPERHVREAMAKGYPQAKDNATFHIGMLHGSLAGDHSHAVYAPFTKEELLSKGYDYWALGHIHLRQHLHEEPSIVYPGNIQGRHRNERGLKGFYEVDLSKVTTTFEFIQTSTLVFERIEVSCIGIRHANEWLEACKDALVLFKEQYGEGIVEIMMIDIDEQSADLFLQSSEEEWLDILRELMNENTTFIWVQSIQFEQQLKSQEVRGTLLVQSVLGTMANWSTDEWKIITKELYQHTRGMKYLDVLTIEDIKVIKQEAEQMLIEEMLKVE